MIFYRIIALVLLFATVINGWSQSPSQIRQKDSLRQSDTENLQVLHQWLTWNQGGRVLIDHLIGQADELYNQRNLVLQRIRTAGEWKERQEYVRRKLRDILGSFPDKTPLNPEVTGIIRNDGYRIEKVIYQSRPGYYVTGCLYVPEKIKGRVPAVLNLIGHEQESFRAELDQVMATNLVLQGMVVFTIDPPGQGEHQQYYDPKIKFSAIGYSVVEHSYFGNQSFLVGVSSAKYFIWDAIRAIDYLVSRREVDSNRIGVTGFSGGGTITSYVGALDERVLVSVPSSWSTSNRRQLQTKGAQDAEANLIGSLPHGLTFEDLIEVRAPKPTMLTFTTRDEYLTVQGAREAYQEISGAYDALGARANIQYVEDDAKHWLTPMIRQSIYQFFQTHFGMAGNAAERNIDVYPPEQLNVTPTGQISTFRGGDMISDISRRVAERCMEGIKNSRLNTDQHLKTVVDNARDLSGYQRPSTIGDAFINGQYRRDGYTVTKLAIQGEGMYPIPMLLFKPEKSAEPHPAVVFLHPEGKNVDAAVGGEIERLVRRGFVVAAPDVSGVGEIRNTVATELAVCYTAVLIGRSIVGIQAGDIVRVAAYLTSRDDVDKGKIGAYAKGQMCIPLMHAASFDQSFSEIAMVDALVSYRSVALTRLFRIGLIQRKNGGKHHPYDVDFSWGVAGALTGYDLPDLVASMAPRRVLLSRPVDASLGYADESTIRDDLAFAVDAYKYRSAAGQLYIDHKGDSNPVEWFFK